MPDPARILPITNMKGLHARAAAKFVKIAESFDAQVYVSKVGEAANESEHKAIGTSILGLMMLGAECGSQIAVQGIGAQAEQALDALENLVRGKFGESE